MLGRRSSDRLNAKRLLAPYRAAVDEAVRASYFAVPKDGVKLGSGGRNNILQISLCADMAYLRHAWVAMAPAIERASAPVAVHLLGDGLASGAVETLSAACRELAGASLNHQDVTGMLSEVQSKSYYSRAIMGRMFLPQLVDGRVLYLDSDTMTCADISPLFEMEMGSAKTVHFTGARKPWDPLGS